MVDLLPCPFCGNDEPREVRRMDESVWSHAAVEWLHITCDECNAESASSEVHEDVIAAWNRRAASSAVAASSEPQKQSGPGGFPPRPEGLEIQKAPSQGCPCKHSDCATDAARYRWLREQQWNTASLFVIAGSKSLVRLGTDCPSLDRLDAAIDAASAGEGSK